MSSLDYPHTCPDIDQAIKDFDGEVDSTISYLIDLKKLFESLAEDVRSQNSDIRDRASSQLDELEEERYRLQMEVEDKDTEISELGQQIRNLETENYNLLNSK